MNDEDEVTELVTWGGEITLIRTGLDMAKMRARSAYIHGRIEVEEFEAEIGRLLEKEAALLRLR